MKVWALIPARAGSETIPNKNMHPLAGVPLIDYVVKAALSCHSVGSSQSSDQVLDRIVCSTDSTEISRHVIKLGIEATLRPVHLSQGNMPVALIAIDMLSRYSPDVHPDAILFMQPTSPFVTAEQIGRLRICLVSQGTKVHGITPASAQTVTKVSHNDHEWNQRDRSPSTGFIEFVHKTERYRAFNAGKKPERYKFGNLVITRVEALIEQCTFFAHPSQSLEIPWPYQMDIDNEKDFLLAEAIIEKGLVDLPHMEKDL